MSTKQKYRNGREAKNHDRVIAEKADLEIKIQKLISFLLTLNPHERGDEIVRLEAQLNAMRDYSFALEQRIGHFNPRLTAAPPAEDDGIPEIQTNIRGGDPNP